MKYGTWRIWYCWARGERQSMPFTPFRLMSTFLMAKSGRFFASFAMSGARWTHGGQKGLVKSITVVLPLTNRDLMSRVSPGLLGLTSVTAPAQAMEEINATANNAAKTGRSAEDLLVRSIAFT